MRRMVVAASLAFLLALPVSAQTKEQKIVAQIDRSFICPEALPSDDARKAALQLFISQVAAAKPRITVNELTAFRVAMLRKHGCAQTLANIGEKAQAAPTYNNSDHWQRAGSVPGPQGMVITVDMDSMANAGPGKLRTWIKYRWSTVGPKNVKESLIYEQLDCARRYHSTLSLYSYAPDGHIVLSETGKPEDEEPIIPESMLAGILPFTCAAHGLATGR